MNDITAWCKAHWNEYREKTNWIVMTVKLSKAVLDGAVKQWGKDGHTDRCPESFIASFSQKIGPACCWVPDLKKLAADVDQRIKAVLPDAPT